MKISSSRCLSKVSLHYNELLMRDTHSPLHTFSTKLRLASNIYTSQAVVHVQQHKLCHVIHVQQHKSSCEDKTHQCLRVSQVQVWRLVTRCNWKTATWTWLPRRCGPWVMTPALTGTVTLYTKCSKIKVSVKSRVDQSSHVQVNQDFVDFTVETRSIECSTGKT